MKRWRCAPTRLKDGDKTNGVEFLIYGETANGPRRQIFRRLLDPANQPADRGQRREGAVAPGGSPVATTSFRVGEPVRRGLSQFQSGGSEWSGMT